jgi:hypothetical protein
MYTASLLEKFRFDHLAGAVYFKSTGKKLEPSWDGYVVVQIPEGRKKLKYNKFCMELLMKESLPKGSKILHLNLDETDTKVSNMRLLDSESYRRVKEALANLEGGIKIQIHPKDSYAYIVSWTDNAVKKSKVLQDAVVAQRFALRLKLKYSKILTKYCIFDS